MSQFRLRTWLIYLRMLSMAQCHGNARNAAQSMDSKEQLLIFLVLFLFIGGVAMGYMTGLNHG
jgi:hypothetical protein